MILFKDGSPYKEYEYQTEKEFETDVIENAQLFFGKKSIYIDAKKKITSKGLGNSIPDGFLFDLNDIENPEFYIVEAELYKHDFYGHIFPQVTKFFAFFRNFESRRDLVEKIYSLISSDQEIEKKLKTLTKTNELYKFLSDAIENSQNILLIIDREKKELPEIMDTYTDTWGKMVKLQIIKKFVCGSECIFTLDPEIEKIEFSLVKDVDDVDLENIEISEEFHLEKADENVKNIYQYLKKRLLEINDTLLFNPQKYYLSVKNERNILFYKIRRKKIRLIVLLPIEEIKEQISKHTVKPLSESVQKFYNSPCATVDIEDLDNIDEVIDLLRPLVSRKEHI